MKQKKISASREVYLILHNIRSTHNVGAIFRTADAVGVDKIFLTGYTPSPVDRFGRSRSDIAKAALGTEKTVEWESARAVSSVFSKLKKRGVQLIAIEQGMGSLDYKKATPTFPTAFIVGNEVTGLTKSILTKVDVIAEIPMRGKKESLNVSVACGVALFRMLQI